MSKPLFGRTDEPNFQLGCALLARVVIRLHLGGERRQLGPSNGEGRSLAALCDRLFNLEDLFVEGVDLATFFLLLLRYPLLEVHKLVR